MSLSVVRENLEVHDIHLTFRRRGVFRIFIFFFPFETDVCCCFANSFSMMILRT